MADQESGSGVRFGRRIGLQAAVVAVVSTVSSGATILALGDRVTSRAQAIANADGGRSEPVLVPVERRELDEALSFRAAVDQSARSSVRLVPGIDGVITRVILKAGGTIRAGSALLEIEGRPLIALPGRFRAYRTIVAGDHGPDVEQLQSALRALGYRIADARGTYGPGTQAALGKLYRRLGWQIPYHTGPADPAGSSAAGEPTAPPVGTAATGTIEARADELLFLPKLPQPVDTVAVRPGQVAAGADTVLSTYTTATRLGGAVPAGRAELTAEGTRVMVDVEGDRPAAGRIVPASADADADAAGTGSGDEVRVAVVLDDRRALAEGRSYKVTVPGRRSAGPVLAVPLTAVNERADGTAFVTVQQPNAAPGTGADVDVVTGVQADGWIEVSPLESRQLDVGTLVVVGGEGPS